MCLILFAYKSHPKYKLVLAANRDEFYARPTEPAAYWLEHPDLLAGKDLEAGGTWMGMHKAAGKLCLLTNYRDPANLKTDAPSRGGLVTGYLSGDVTTQQYLATIAPNAHRYNGFNIILGSLDELWYFSNQFKGGKKIPIGIYGLSNHLLNTQWPKTAKGKLKLKAILEETEIQPEFLFSALYDDQIAPDDQLPNTGIGLEKERMLSPMFIKSPVYGTRCSTVVLVDQKNKVLFAERTYNTETFDFQDKVYTFKV